MPPVNIIVLIKQVPDPKAHVSIKEDGTLDRERAKAVINPYDRYAIEAALKVKEKLGAKVIALSMGPPKAEDALREALAMGVDEAILLSDRRLAGSDTLATSYALSRAIRKIGHYDLILCGMETVDGNTGQVGPEIAEHLGIPQITYVENFEIRDGFVRAKRLIEGGYEILRSKLPVLLTITNTGEEPRCATFLGVVKAVKKDIVVCSIDDIGVEEDSVGLKGSPTKVKKIERAVLCRSKYIVKGGSVEEIVDNLLKKLEEDGIDLVMMSE